MRVYFPQAHVVSLSVEKYFVGLMGLGNSNNIGYLLGFYETG